MKRYLLFLYDEFAADGGWEDFQGDFHTLDQAKEKAMFSDYDQGHIVDIETKEIVEKFYCTEL